MTIRIHHSDFKNPETRRKILGAHTPKKTAVQHEHHDQKQVIKWAWHPATLKLYPVLEFLYAVPNGGMRNLIVAKKLKAEGTNAGTPDLVLPLHNRGYAGLYIEMKSAEAGGRVKPRQRRFLNFLAGQGYCVAVCWNDTQAIDLLEWYCKKDTQPVPVVLWKAA